MTNSGNSSSFKRRVDTKEKTARDKALEFARNIPKPKAGARMADGRHTGGDDISSIMNDHNGVIEEEPFDEYGNTLKGSEMNDLNTRHEHLANEVDKLKRMFK